MPYEEAEIAGAVATVGALISGTVGEEAARSVPSGAAQVAGETLAVTGAEVAALAAVATLIIVIGLFLISLGLRRGKHAQALG